MNIPYVNTFAAIAVLALAVLVAALEVRLLGVMLWRKVRGKTAVQVRRRQIVLHCLAGVLAVCVLYGMFVEPYWPQITTVRLETDKLEKTTLRIVQLSDLHCDPKARLEGRLPGLVNALKPDVIVFTGDAINRVEAQGLFVRTLAAMEAPLGKFAVRGNWDYRFQTKPFEGTGFEELALKAVRLEKEGEAFMVCGVNYYNGRFSHRAIDPLDPETWNVLLYHSPDLLDFLEDKPVDLYVCGHTHGGQIALPFYGAMTTMSKHGKSYEAGLYTVGTMPAYVNRGIGMGGFGPRMRFLARPEITLFEIRPAGGAVPPSEGQGD